MKKLLLFITAIFICGAAIAQTIRWHIGDTVYQTTTCNAGESITPPTVPDRFGYTFIRYDAYTPIEYLESTGTQYIDTGYIPNQDTEVKLKVMIDAIENKYNNICGSGESYNSKVFELYIWDGIFGSNYGNSNTPSGVLINANDVIEIDKNKNIVTFSVNNITKSVINQVYSNFVSPYQMRIFGITRPQSVSYLYDTGKMKLYYFQIYDNDVLVRDFIPVLDGNGTPCMYDKVEGKFYYNAGTGQFIAGPVIGE